MLDEEEILNQEKILTLTKNELLFLSDSVTLLMEHYVEVGKTYVPARQLMPSALVPVPMDIIQTIGMGLLIATDPENIKQQADVSFAVVDLYLIRECCLSYRKINKERVGYNLLRKVYEAMLESTMSERVFINKLTAGVDFKAAEPQLKLGKLNQKRIEELKDDSESKST